jgi:hypothetical protein
MFVPVGLVIDSCRDRVFARYGHPILLYHRCRILVRSEFGASFEGIVRGVDSFVVSGNPYVERMG